jgi:hypothetical protein
MKGKGRYIISTVTQLHDTSVCSGIPGLSSNVLLNVNLRYEKGQAPLLFRYRPLSQASARLGLEVH